MRSSWRWFGALILFATVACASPAVAQESASIGIWSDANATVLSRRLIAELRVRGFVTRELADPGALEDLDAGVWLSESPVHARICTLRTAPHCEEIADADESVLLIRVVEALRAELGEQAHALQEARALQTPLVAQQSSEDERPSPIRLGDVPQERVSMPESRFALTLAPSVLMPLRGLSTSVHVLALLEWEIAPRIGVELGASTSIVSAMATDAVGSASVDTTFAWIGAHARLIGSFPHTTSMLVAIGAGFGNANIRADAVAPYTESSSSELFALLTGRVVVRIPISEVVSIDPGAIVGVALPSPVLVFAGREVAHTFQPLVALQLGVSFHF